jgi:hypothetical protein
VLQNKDHKRGIKNLKEKRFRKLHYMILAGFLATVSPEKCSLATYGVIIFSFFELFQRNMIKLLRHKSIEETSQKF